MMNYTMLEEAGNWLDGAKKVKPFPFIKRWRILKINEANKERGTFSPSADLRVLLAKMAGETTLQAIAEWIRFRSQWVQEVLPETRATFPCAATYSNVLRTVDPAQVNQVLMDLFTRVRAETTRSRRTRACGARWKEMTRNTTPSGRRSKENASSEFV